MAPSFVFFVFFGVAVARDCADLAELEWAVTDAEWYVEDAEYFFELDCPEPVPDAVRLDRVPRQLHRVECSLADGARECARTTSQYRRLAKSWQSRVKRQAGSTIKRKARCDAATQELNTAKEQLESAKQALETCKAPAPAPQPVDLIVGVNSIAQGSCCAPPGYLAEDTNKGYGGKYVYVKARVEKSLEGIAGFEFRQHSSAMYGGDDRITGDLAKGAGGTYRYLVPVGTRPPESAVNRVWWTETRTKNCTGDINKGRGGRYLYFCWSHYGER